MRVSRRYHTQMNFLRSISKVKFREKKCIEWHLQFSWSCFNKILFADCWDIDRSFHFCSRCKYFGMGKVQKSTSFNTRRPSLWFIGGTFWVSPTLSVSLVSLGHTSCLSLTPGVTTHHMQGQDIRDSHLIHLIMVIIVISVLINTRTGCLCGNLYAGNIFKSS